MLLVVDPPGLPPRLVALVGLIGALGLACTGDSSSNDSQFSASAGESSFTGASTSSGDLTETASDGESESGPTSSSGASDSATTTTTTTTTGGVATESTSTASSTTEASTTDEPTGFLCQDVDFTFSDTDQAFTVPDGVHFMQVKAWGAGSNGEGKCGDNNDDAGVGGYAEAYFEVEPGDELIVMVGEYGNYNQMEMFKYGFGGSGGGGLSGIFTGSEMVVETDQERALIIAGGGGSAARNVCGYGIPGNHPNAGGMETMQGQLAQSGGGGGYFGGPAGGGDKPGVGGTGYIHPSAEEPQLLFVEPGSIAPPMSDDPEYDGDAGTVESNGQIVLHFFCEDPIPG